MIRDWSIDLVVTIEDIKKQRLSAVETKWFMAI